MARRVDEGDPRARGQRYLVGADVLGDAAGLAGRDIGRPQRVQQRRLAVVDMAHDGHHGGAGHQIGVLVDLALDTLLDIALGYAAHAVAELLHHQLGRVGIQHLRDRRHHAEPHQRLDHIDGARRHAVGQLLHGDRIRQHHVAHHAHLVGTQRGQLGGAAFALALTAYAGQRAGLLVLALDGSLHVDPAGAASFAESLLGHDWGEHAAWRHHATGPADSAAPVFLVLASGAQAQRLGRRAWGCGRPGGRCCGA